MRLVEILEPVTQDNAVVGTQVVNEGVFHGFGLQYVETNEGQVGNYSTAIVELKDGSMLNHPVEWIKFQKPSKIIQSVPDKVKNQIIKN